MSATVSNLVVGRSQVRSALATLAELHQRTSPTSQQAVLPTGFEALDQVLAGGIRPGEVMLLGGKPGVGKTIAALQWARSMAQQGVVVVYVCYEHDEVTLLTRLLSCELGELIAEAPGGPGSGTSSCRRASATSPRARSRCVRRSIRTRCSTRPNVAFAAYADRILFVTGSGAHTNVPAIADVTRRYEGQPVALFVDYVQKVPVFPAVPLERERVGQVIESLKQLALDQKLVVVAITAADQAGLDARRLHLRHFRGSTALAYEADAVVVLNEKLAVVSRATSSTHRRGPRSSNARSCSRWRRTATGRRTSTSSSRRTSPTTAFTREVAGWPNGSGPRDRSSCRSRHNSSNVTKKSCGSRRRVQPCPCKRRKRCSTSVSVTDVVRNADGVATRRSPSARVEDSTARVFSVEKNLPISRLSSPRRNPTRNRHNPLESSVMRRYRPARYPLAFLTVAIGIAARAVDRRRRR